MACILVVEDDALLRQLFAESLAEEGHTELTAVDGEDALDHVQDHPPALLVLDLMLPRKSGWEVLEDLRAHPDYCLLPVLVVSAVAQGQEEALRRTGATEVMDKPFDVDELLQRVQRLTTRA